VLAHAQRVAIDRPSVSVRLVPLANRYAQLRYGEPGTAIELREFLRGARVYRVE
jgi:hypothetical protein